MLPLFPSSRITPIDESSPLRKPDDIPEEPLISSPPKFVIDENMQHVLSSLKKQKDKKQKSLFRKFTFTYLLQKKYLVGLRKK